MGANSPLSLLCYTTGVQRFPRIFCLVFLTACTFDQSHFGILDDGGIGPTPIDGGTVDSRTFVDSGPLPDATLPAAAPQPCTQFSEFSEPATIAELSSVSLDNAPTLTADELSVFFHSNRAAGLGGRDLWTATRLSLAEPFSAPTNITSVNSINQEFGVSVSPDGLELYFGSNRAGGSGYDIWRATRTTRSDEFSTPTNVTNVNSSSVEYFPTLSNDRLSLYFTSNRLGGAPGYDIWIAKRLSVSDEFNTPNLMPAINSNSADEATALSADGLTFLVQSGRAQNNGGLDVWISTRASINEDFAAPTNLASINSASNDQATWFSPDSLRLYQASSRTGVWNLYVSTRSCTMR